MITTERLILRPFEKDDYEPYLAVAADPRPQVPWREPMSSENAWHRLIGHWSLFGYGNFAVLEKSSGIFLGETGLWDAHRGMGAGYDEYDETGWSVIPNWHGRGVAFEAAEAAHRWYADAVGRQRTVCMTDPANKRSIRIAAKLGYVPFREGVYKGKAVRMFERAI